MLMGEAILAVFLALHPQQEPDSATALRQAEELVLEQYDNVTISGRFNRREVWGSGRACGGVSLHDCMPQGDWSCLDTGCAFDHAERRADLEVAEENERRTLRDARARITVDMLGRDIGRGILFALGGGGGEE